MENVYIWPLQIDIDTRSSRIYYGDLQKNTGKRIQCHRSPHTYCYRKDVRRRRAYIDRCVFFSNSSTWWFVQSKYGPPLKLDHTNALWQANTKSNTSCWRERKKKKQKVSGCWFTQQQRVSSDNRMNILYIAINIHKCRYRKRRRAPLAPSRPFFSWVLSQQFPSIKFVQGRPSSEDHRAIDKEEKRKKEKVKEKQLSGLSSSPKSKESSIQIGRDVTIGYDTFPPVVSAPSFSKAKNPTSPLQTFVLPSLLGLLASLFLYLCGYL